MKLIFPLEVLFLVRGVGVSYGRINTSAIIVIAGSVCLMTACPVKPDASAANHSNICRGSTPQLTVAQLYTYIYFHFRKPEQPDLGPPSSFFFVNCRVFFVCFFYLFIYLFWQRCSGSNRRTVSRFEFGQNNKVIKGDQHIVSKTLPVTGPPTLPQSDGQR